MLKTALAAIALLGALSTHTACADTISNYPNKLIRLLDLGAEPVGNTPEEFARQIRADTAWWSALVKSTHTTLD